MSDDEQPSGVEQRAMEATVVGEFIGADASALPEGLRDAELPEGAPEKRYEDRGIIASGGQGDVRRVFDRHVGRVVAMKILSFDKVHHVQSHARFWHEARVTANLHHPAIVPVHDMGLLTDGRPYFTMAEVRGDTFDDQITALHALKDSGEQQRGLRRLIQWLVRVCEGLAYAHSRGIVHHDVKPQNMMVGRFGEVMVMDWGLASKVRSDSNPGLGMATATWEPPSTIAVEAAPDGDTLEFVEELQSAAGLVAGTICYMSPEQAQGERDLIGSWTDVYALGAVLYQILTGEPPYAVGGAKAFAALLSGPPRDLTTFPPSPLRPEPLRAICSKAMDREPSRRWHEASGVAGALGDWLDDVERHDRARGIVKRADRLWQGGVAEDDADATPVSAAAPQMGSIEELRRQEQSLRRQAARLLAAVKPHDPAWKKKPAWALEDHADELASSAAVQLVEWEQTLRSALNEVPEFDEAHQRLATYYRESLERAEQERKRADMARSEALLRLHDRGDHAAFLTGKGTVTLRTDPPARVLMYRYATKHRRLVPKWVGVLGETPLIDVEVPSGSYLLVLKAKGCQKVRYPILVPRAGAWTGAGPDGEPFTLRLPRRGELAKDDVFVPAGPFIAGGDPAALESMTRRVVWLPSFVIKRHPVTCAEYLAFLNALVDEGREEEAERHAPKMPLGATSENHHAFFRDTQGRFGIGKQTDAWDPRHPVALISWFDASAYTTWLSTILAQPWRLPAELEWEKSARGTDGRPCPWGDFGESTFANILGSREVAPGPYAVNDDHHYAKDRSAYGVRGLAGNVREWCADYWTSDGERESSTHVDEKLRSVRGGSWTSSVAPGRAASRYGGKPDYVFLGLGFRVARST